MQEQQAPIAHSRPFAQLQGDGLGIVEAQVEVRRVLGLGAGDFLFGRRRLDDTVQRIQHGACRRLQIVPLAHARLRQEQARLAELEGERGGRRSQTRLDQVLVEPARGRRAHQAGQHFEGRELLVGTGGDVVGRHSDLDVADATQRDCSLAVLCRFGGVRFEQFVGPAAVGSWDGAELLLYQIDSLLGIEAASDDQHRVVGLVVLPIEAPQAVERHVLNVRACADRRVAVVVP